MVSYHTGTAKERTELVKTSGAPVWEVDDQYVRGERELTRGVDISWPRWRISVRIHPKLLDPPGTRSVRHTEFLTTKSTIILLFHGGIACPMTSPKISRRRIESVDGYPVKLDSYQPSTSAATSFGSEGIRKSTDRHSERPSIVGNRESTI